MIHLVTDHVRYVILTWWRWRSRGSQFLDGCWRRKWVAGAEAATDDKVRYRCSSCCFRYCLCPCRFAAAVRSQWRARDQGQARGEAAEGWLASLSCRRLPMHPSAGTSSTDLRVACQGYWTRIRCFRIRIPNLRWNCMDLFSMDRINRFKFLVEVDFTRFGYFWN